LDENQQKPFHQNYDMEQQSNFHLHSNISF
jgi:hypothetical protein